MEFGDVVFVKRHALRVSFDRAVNVLGEFGDGWCFYVAGRGVKDRRIPGDARFPHQAVRKRWPGGPVPLDYATTYPKGFTLQVLPKLGPYQATTRVRLFPLRAGGIIVGHTRMLEGRAITPGPDLDGYQDANSWVTERVVPVLQVAIRNSRGPARLAYAIASDVALWVPRLEGVA